MTTTGLLPDVGTELREGYAQVGDQSLHYVEAGDGPLIVLLHGFPEFWFGWRLQIAPLAAAGFRVVAPDTRGYNLSSKPEDFEDYAVDLLADDIRGLIGELGAESALLVGHDWGGSIAWTTAMNHPEVVDRLAILNAAHPRRLQEGLHNPNQLRKSWYFFFFAVPGLPEDIVHARDWHFFRHFLQDANPPYTPQEIDRYVEAWSQPGAAAGMINYYRASVQTVPEGSHGKASPDLGADAGHLGGARFLPRLRTRRARPRRRTQPRPCGAPARRVALGASRRGRTRQPTAYRLLRPHGIGERLAQRLPTSESSRPWSCSGPSRKPRLASRTHIGDPMRRLWQQQARSWALSSRLTAGLRRLLATVR